MVPIQEIQTSKVHVKRLAGSNLIQYIDTLYVYPVETGC